VALWDITNHSYYDSPKYKDLKIESATCALAVSDLLPAIVNKAAQELKESAASSSTSASSNKNNEQDFEEKMEEVKLLREVSREHYHFIVSESSSTSNTRSRRLSNPNLRQSEVKKEVLEVDDGFPSWLSVLECGDSISMSSLNICLKGQGQQQQQQQHLSTVTEDEVYNSATRDRDRDHDHDHDHAPKRDDRAPPSAAQGRGRGRGQKELLKPKDLERANSAPAHLGLQVGESAPSPLPLPSSPSNVMKDRVRVDTEVREPPPDNIMIPSYYDAPEQKQNGGAVVGMVGETKSREEAQYESDLERAMYLSGLEFQPASQDANSPHHDRFPGLKPVLSDAIAIVTLATLFHHDFEEMRRNGVIHVNYLDTYQGRVRESVNGCTVIAPLLAIHHLCNDRALSDRNHTLIEGKESSEYLRSNLTSDEGSMGGIDNETIRIVIDIQSALVLPKVRSKLGLHKDALIIPADVHDYLIEENFLLQRQFAGVYGGNILDDRHLSQLIDNLSTLGRGEGVDVDTAKPVNSRKVAATFFFHEHVVSLHRVTRHIITSFQNHEHISPKGRKGSPSKSSSKSFFR
jgi:hypothetical protein